MTKRHFLRKIQHTLTVQYWRCSIELVATVCRHFRSFY